MSIEAMKIALDALDEAADKIYCEKDDDSIGMARKALRKAIKQAEKQWFVAYRTGYESGQRKWVGLTNKEIESVYRKVNKHPEGATGEELARAIETKLKEKNT